MDTTPARLQETFFDLLAKTMSAPLSPVTTAFSPLCR
jgi:hypothetical protein